VNRARARDEGLSRVSSITRWVAALGVAGTAALAGFVYKAVPGRSSSASTPAQGGGTVSTPDPNAGDNGFQAPAQAPVPVQRVPIVRSGSS
jgi:hypothetical protein